MSKLKRSNNFVPQLLAYLATHDRFSCRFQDVPKSYQKQPYNLAAKLLARGGIDARVVFSKEHDTFSLVRFSVSTKPTTTKKKNKKHVKS